MTKDEALKLALEALENSVDLVREDAYNAEKLYGNYPSRQGKVAGLKVLADDHDKAITAIKEALAQPAPVQEPVAHRDGYWCVDLTCKKCYSADFRFKHTTPPAQPEQESVAWMHDVVAEDGEPDQALSFAPDTFPLQGVGGFRSVCVRPLVFGDTTPTAQPAPVQEPVAKVVPCHTPSGKRVALHTDYQHLPIGTDLYTTPPQRKPLTDEEMQRMAKRIEELEAMLEQQTARIVDLQTHIANLEGE